MQLTALQTQRATTKLLETATYNIQERKRRMPQQGRREAAPADRSPLTPDQQRARKEGYCLDFAIRGSCTRGDSCRFKHEVPSYMK